MFMFFGELTGIFPIVYIIFMIIDLIRQHKKGKKILKRFFIELGCGLGAFFVLMVIFTSSASLDSQSDDSEQSKTHRLSPEQKAEKNWKNKTISFSDGTFKINRISKIKAYTFNSNMVSGLLLVGKFTNKSSKAVPATDFLSDHTKVTVIGKKTEDDLDPTAYRESSPEYQQLFRNADNKTRPHKTVNCAVHYMGDQAIGEDIPNNFRFQITNDDDVLYSVHLSNLPVVKTNISMDNVLNQK